MNHSLMRISALAAALALSATAVAAPPAAGDAGGKPAREHRAMKIDANQDGVVDRDEAAAHPRLGKVFDRLDANADGRLQRDELRRAGKHRGHRAGRMHGMHRVIALDSDGDGRISKTEAEGSGLAERFADTDGNGDGYLVRSELQAEARARREAFMARHAERAAAKFRQADGNGDGRLSRAEVEAAWPRKAKAFAFMDEDRDGFLLPADLEPMRGH